MKRALVTGGCGFIGSNLTRELVSQGWIVDVVDDMSNGHLELLELKIEEDPVPTPEPEKIIVIATPTPDVQKTQMNSNENLVANEDGTETKEVYRLINKDINKDSGPSNGNYPKLYIYNVPKILMHKYISELLYLQSFYVNFYHLY